MGTTRDAVVTCRVCHRAYAKYTCPRCFTRYCALACYKAHDSRCVQSFHGENLGDAMRGLTVEDEDKRRMTEILAKYADREPDGGDERPLDEPLPLDEHAHDAHDEHDEHDDDDEDDERGTCVLSEANLEKLSRGLDLTPADLDPRERSGVRARAATGELSHMVEAWTPWWTRPESCDITLARDGTKIIRELAAHTSDTFEPPGSSSGRRRRGRNRVLLRVATLAPEEPLPPTSRLTSAAPSPALRWHLLDVLAAYTLTMRAHDGDWRADPVAAASALLALPDVVRGRVVRPGPIVASRDGRRGDARRRRTRGDLDERRHGGGGGGRGGWRRRERCARRAARRSRRGGGGAGRRAARRQDRRRRRHRRGCGARRTRARRGRNARGTFARVERKLFFMACWANAAAKEDGTLELLASWAAREAARGKPPPAGSRARKPVARTLVEEV